MGWRGGKKHVFTNRRRYTRAHSGNARQIREGYSRHECPPTCPRMVSGDLDEDQSSSIIVATGKFYVSSDSLPDSA